MPRLTLAERETILRWDDEERMLHVYTSSPTTERRWRKRNIPLKPSKGGHGFEAVIPLRALRPLRAMDGGQLKPGRKVAIKKPIKRKKR